MYIHMHYYTLSHVLYSLQDDILGKIKDEGVTCLRIEYIVDIQQDPPPLIDQFIVWDTSVANIIVIRIL